MASRLQYICALEAYRTKSEQELHAALGRRRLLLGPDVATCDRLAAARERLAVVLWDEHQQRSHCILSHMAANNAWRVNPYAVQPGVTLYDVARMTVPELKAALGFKGFTTSGTKDVLQRRLMIALAPEPDEPARVSQSPDGDAQSPDGDSQSPDGDLSPDGDSQSPDRKRMKLAPTPPRAASPSVAEDSS